MKLKEFRIQFTQTLSSIFPKTEIDTFFFILVEEYLGLQRIDVSLEPNFEIHENKLTLLNEATQKLQKEEPIQYILGKTEFYGFPFLVDSNTLIPRPETEELVEWILLEVKKLQSEKITKAQTNTSSNLVEKSLKILDIGTGTGCIPISLAKNLQNVEISAIDISAEALTIAKKNAILNNVSVNFIDADILKIEKLHQQFDIIISNPPYVRELEKVEIKNNVLENEPHLALFVDDDNPLVFYNKIADLAKTHLTKDGLLFFEINQYLGKETVEILEQKSFKNIELRKDLFGNFRMIKTGINTYF